MLPFSTWKTSKLRKLYQLIVVSVLIGFLASFLAIAIKRITEHLESVFFAKAVQYPIYCFLFPLIGLTVIYFLRKNLFKNKENKGIKEIFE